MSDPAAQLMAQGQSHKLHSLISFLQSILPPTERDVSFIYHKLRRINVDTAEVSRLIFSVVPTKGVYKTFSLPRKSGVDVYFLHRPWKLERHKDAEIWRRPRVVLSSHKVFDELLTVGWNEPLARRLGLAVERAVCLQGYKGDPDRRIGLVAPFTTVDEHARSFSSLLSDVKLTRSKILILEQIRQQFGSIEKTVGFITDRSTSGAEKNDDDRIRVIAIMNAFHPAEIQRIAIAAVSAGFIQNEKDCQEVLCLTGEPRDEGIAAAVDKGMKVVCVGHRSCEDWGLRYLMERVQQAFPSLELHLIDEPEEVEPQVLDAEQKRKSDAL